MGLSKKKLQKRNKSSRKVSRGRKNIKKTLFVQHGGNNVFTPLHI